MDVGVAIALYTVMIGVITLFGGLYFAVGSRLVTEVSGYVGRGWFWKGESERCVLDLDRRYGELVKRIDVLVRDRVGDVGKRRDLKEQIEVAKEHVVEKVSALRGMVTGIDKTVSELRSVRSEFVRQVFSDLAVVVCGVVILIVLLSVVGSGGWEYSVWVAWIVFLVEVVYCLWAVWKVVEFLNVVLEQVECLELLMVDCYESVSGKGGEESVYWSLTRLEENLARKEGG